MSGRSVRAEMERLRGTVRARSAVTGRFVKLWWAITHPRQAVIEKTRR